MSKSEIKLFQGKLHISMSIEDSFITAAFTEAYESGKNLEEHFLKILSLGVQVSALGSNTAGAEKIEASIGQAKSVIKEVASDFESQIKKQVLELSSEDGSLVTSLDAIIDTFKQDIDLMTAGEDSPFRAAMLKSLADAQQKIRDDIAAQVARQKQEIAHLLDPSEPTSPLRSLTDKLDVLNQAVAKVQEDVTKSQAVLETQESGVIGGADYEELAIKSVQMIASFAGDECMATGHFTGRIARSKMGDGVVDLKVGSAVYARLALEAKNKELTKLDWEREALGAKDNRAATGFIGLCKHLEDMPNKNRVLILDSQSIVVAYNPEIENAEFLALVYQLVKVNTLNSLGQLDDINMAEVNKNLEDSVKALERFDEITKNASAIRNSADKITKEANSIREVVSSRLQAAQNAIIRGLEPEALDSATTVALGFTEVGSIEE